MLKFLPYEFENKPFMIPARKKLFGPARTPLEVMGQFQGDLKYHGKESKQTVYVVKGLKTNLFGLPAIMDLNLVALIGETNTTHADTIYDQFPSLFQGIGNLGEPYHIQLKADAKPYALFTTCNVPLPLHTKVYQEIKRVEEIGIISKVDLPTQWCAGMVVVPKKNGSVRICVDLKPLNSSVLREIHPLPTVEDILAQLSGAKVFSKLDANSGFWQIPLTEESRLLTTFITPFGRYCFNKLPFGIST